jgi:hypothetical protein
MLRKAIQKKLDDLGDVYGMTIRLGNIRYDGISFRTKLEAHIDQPASGQSFEKESFDKDCMIFGLKPEDYLKEVRLGNGSLGKVYGFNFRAKRYPVLVRTSNGQTFKCSSFVLQQLKK